MPNNNTILVTGGAGYIGSVVCKLLVKEGYNIIVVDDLSKGHKKALSPEAKFYQCSTLDIDAFKNVFKENKNIDAIMHFAANIEVGESVKAPDKYFYNNVVGSLNTIDMAKKYGVKGFILSSTAAVYGKPEKVPITEDSHLLPINPYGVSKLQVEQFLKYYYEAFGLKYSCLRYFNACGAYEDLGEDHNPETHLIPNIFKVTLIEKKPLNIFGSNYDTPDGTAIRDYIHVEDLATAHILALKAILDNKISNEMFNIGSSSGYSVLEVVKTSEKVAGEEILHVLAPPRVGDPPRLIADNTKIQQMLGWKPKHDMTSILSSAYKWHRKNPNGYEDSLTLTK